MTDAFQRAVDALLQLQPRLAPREARAAVAAVLSVYDGPPPSRLFATAGSKPVFDARAPDQSDGAAVADGASAPLDVPPKLR